MVTSNSNNQIVAEEEEEEEEGVNTESSPVNNEEEEEAGEASVSQNNVLVEEEEDTNSSEGEEEEEEGTYTQEEEEEGEQEGEGDSTSQETMQPTGNNARRTRQPERQMVFRDFLRFLIDNRIIAGARINYANAPTDNAELVNILKSLHIIRSDSVEKALLACPRGNFVPQQHIDEAYLDAPIRVTDMEFNISAPHMHATCLEALDIKKGEKFLDVGSGCGIVAACAAYIVGKEGECIGIDIKKEILDFSKLCLNKLTEENENYANESCTIEFREQNVFMPHRDNYYDKIHVGATCPDERLPVLISLLKPDGGKMTVPVGQELRLITRKLDGRPTQRVLTQVRFSDLHVPTDADIVLSTMEHEQRKLMHVTVPPSTLDEDIKKVWNISDSALSSSSAMDIDEPESQQIPPKDLTRRGGEDEGLKKMTLSSQGAVQNSQDGTLMDLVHCPNDPDCVLIGKEWSINAHKDVLKARCELFRARFESGMLDADDKEISVPEQFSEDTISIFLQYVYKDELPKDLSKEMTVNVLHAACYYGVPRLVVLCEHILAETLKSEDVQNSVSAAEYAPKLLTLSDENGLQNLRSVTLHYIVNNFDAVKKTDSYNNLSKREIDMIATECHSTFQRYKNLLQTLSDNMSTSSYPAKST